MAATLLCSGAYNRRAIMLKAHAEFRAADWRGRPWTFARCLSFAWALAREEKTRLNRHIELRSAA
jgi:hypothetical protein